MAETRQEWISGENVVELVPTGKKSASKIVNPFLDYKTFIDPVMDAALYRWAKVGWFKDKKGDWRKYNGEIRYMEPAVPRVIRRATRKDIQSIVRLH